MRYLRRILEKLRMFLRQENPNGLDIQIYCDCLKVAGHENLNFPHLVFDLSEFGCTAMSSESDTYLQRMVWETDNILGGQVFVPQLYFACPYKQCIQRNLAARNILPAPVPAAED